MNRKISTSEFYILAMLGKEEKHGYHIMKNVQELLGDTGSFGPAILYTGLQKLLGKGLIKKTKIVGRRRYYGLTLLGSQTLQASLKVCQRVLAHTQSN